MDEKTFRTGIQPDGKPVPYPGQHDDAVVKVARKIDETGLNVHALPALLTELRTALNNLDARG